MKTAIAAACLSVCAFSHAATVSVIDGRYEGEKYLSLAGPIQAGDLARLRALAARALAEGSNDLVLHLNSQGGDVDEAIKIGRWVRQMMAATFAYGSYFSAPGTPEGDEMARLAKEFPQVRFSAVPVQRGQPLPESRIIRCYSACVLIFYGGVNRHVSDNLDARDSRKNPRKLPVIGLHRPYLDKDQFANFSPTEAQSRYAKLESEVRSYLIEMGAPASVADRMLRNASNQLDLVAAEEFESMFQQMEPFLEEWLLARCGPFGPKAALTESEYREYTLYEAARTRAVKEGRLTSAAAISDFVTPETSLEKVRYFESKIKANNAIVRTCHAQRGVRQHQLEMSAKEK